MFSRIRPAIGLTIFMRHCNHRYFATIGLSWPPIHIGWRRPLPFSWARYDGFEIWCRLTQGVAPDTREPLRLRDTDVGF